ncbi:MAG: DUF6439 family protein [Phormidesmis sp.]
MLQKVPEDTTEQIDQSATVASSSHQKKQNTPETASLAPTSTEDRTVNRTALKSFSPEALAQALAEKLAIAPTDWHKLSANRYVRAREQAAAALVYMLKDQPEEALPRLTQAVGWLDKTLKAPPCPTHGEKRQSSNDKAHRHK